MRALMILGPTASGKTALALSMAKQMPVEIISVDSALVYRGMDIGTAKPTADERAQVPHHLIDIRDPHEAYSAAEFCDDTWPLIDAIRARGRLPLLVGGTMLYARTLLQPMDDLPGADPAIRARIDDEAARHGWPHLHQRLATLDAVTAARLPPNDSQRIQRALEIIEITGKPLSELHAGIRPQAHPDLRIISLEPSERSVLHQRIEQRFQQMLDNGFIDEVKALRARPELHAELPSMRAVGYRQVWEMLDGRREPDTLKEAGVVATRQLAKRQITWLRSLPVDLRLDCLDTDNLLPATLDFLSDRECRDRPVGNLLPR
ncbi:MAG: tRNA (adenosine(37)-N6)-dimethylallyltransferase MiaA [Lautropia sp.]|nr:tRNA (adenosine(37)-N6)-dimethylallyltransferase MiaA [Lautropia sp.]